MGQLGAPDPANPYAWSTAPLPAAPHPAVTPLDTTYWQLTPLPWDSARFHQVVAAWVEDRDHLRRLLTERPAWCESARPCDVAVANLLAMCLNPRPCAALFRPGAVTVITEDTPAPHRRRRVETMAPAQFAAAAMRVLLRHVFRACCAVSQARVPIVLDGVPGVWIGGAAPGCDTDVVPAAWGTTADAETVQLAAQVVRDLHAPTGNRSWMDVLCGDVGTASPDAKRAAKMARDDVIRALQSAPARRDDIFRDI